MSPAQKEARYAAFADAKRSQPREFINRDQGEFKVAEGITNQVLDPTNASGKATAVKQPEILKNETDIKSLKSNEVVQGRKSDTRVFNSSKGGQILELSATPQTYLDSTKQVQPIGQDAVLDQTYSLDKLGLSSEKVAVLKNIQAKRYKNEAGTLKTTFEPIGAGSVGINFQGVNFGMAPVTTGVVSPEKVTKKTSSYIQYKNVWQNVDLVYEYKGTTVKESIVINSKPESSRFDFSLTGTKAYVNPKDQNQILLGGALAGRVALGQLNVNVNQKGVIENAPVKQSVSPSGEQISIELDPTWLAAQPADAYPIVIDPPITDITAIPGGAYGDFYAHKSNGYSCNSSLCNVNTGGLVDSGNKFWRTVMKLPYSQASGRQLLGADLYLPMMTTPGWHGTYSGRNIYVAYASCNAFNCVAGPSSSAVIGADGAINVTSTIQWMLDNAGTGGYLIVWGEEWNNSSFKEFDPAGIRLYLYTNQHPTQPNPELPSTNASAEATVSVTEPQLKVSKITDPNGDPIHYQFIVKSTNNNVVWASGLTPSRQAIIPEGILQDGGHYKWEVQYGEYSSGSQYWYISNPVSGGLFKVDLQSTKDKTNTYENMGPLNVSLNTGNVSTSLKTHAISSLGGDIGLSLEYNSPLLGKKGLQAEYYNNTDFSGNPQYRRTEPNINYDWDLGSPVPGVIGNDNYGVRWSGYFIAPVTGNYTFGTTNDDSVKITVQDFTTLMDVGCCNASPVWASSSTYLTAGTFYAMKVEYKEYTSVANMALYVKGAVSEQVVPSDWLRTKAMSTDKTGGLTGHYYYDNGSHDATALTKYLVKTDPTVNFDWGTNSPIPGSPSDNYLVRWEGYFTAPTSGTYKFGVGSDDGARVKVNGVERASQWSAHPYQETYDATGFTLSANQTVPIQVEYFETTDSARVKLLLDGPNGTGDINPQYLTNGAKVLPGGWDVSVDASGGLGFERLKVMQNGDIEVTDGDGSAWLFVNNGTAFISPKDQDSVLTKNSDGTYNLTDSEGKVYIFSMEGMLTSATLPTDDLKPASNKYQYVTQNGKPVLSKIIDRVNSSRFGTLYYQGDSQCRTPYSGFDSNPPAGMLCGFETSNGEYTQFMYKSGSLALISKPGQEDTSLSYFSGNQMLSGYRNTLAEDAAFAGKISQGDEGYSTIDYDSMGRLYKYSGPIFNSSNQREQYTLNYKANSTTLSNSNVALGAGYSKYIEYDNYLRTTKTCDQLGKCTDFEYDANKDLLLSSTDSENQKTTYIYDDQERISDIYGPAPTGMFDSNRVPNISNVNQVAHTEKKYDEGLNGPAVAYYNYEGNITPKGTLFDAPKLHGFGINTTQSVLSKTWTSPPVAIDSGREGWGLSLTGNLKTASSATYEIKASHDDGIKIWVNDILVTEDWADGAYRDTIASFVSSSNGNNRIRIDYYDVPGTVSNNSTLDVNLQKPGTFTWTNNWNTNTQLQPNYGLSTSDKVYDSNISDSVTQTTYSDPAHGVVQQRTVDPLGINLVSGSSFEAQGSGYFRQTARTTPGGQTVTYQHWGENDEADNPCTVGITEAYKQAGLPKGRTDTDPDGAGSQLSRTTENIYDDAGKLIATRIGNDSYTCFNYDTRGRMSEMIIPTVGARAGRTVTYVYSDGGDPRINKKSDSNGFTLSTLDLMGRQISFQDVYGNVTETLYNLKGLITQRSSKLGVETYTYDNYGKPLEYKLDGVTLASLSYDYNQYVSEISYPTVYNPDTGLALKMNTPSRDDFDRVNHISFALPTNETISNGVAYSQSGAVIEESLNDIVLSDGMGGPTYSYDKGGRLVSAKLAGHTYSYEFGTPDANCNSKTGNNPNAGKNSNRTKAIVDGVTTWYCYDFADRLIASSNAQYNTPTYDNHGNTLSLGTSTSTTSFIYDQSDRNTQVLQTSGNVKIDYKRDIDNRIVERKKTTNGTVNGTYFYGSTGSNEQSFMYTNNVTKEVVEKYISLPGGVNLTIRPLETGQGENARVSITNMHGDTMRILNAEGLDVAGGTILYDPFGQKIVRQGSWNNAHSPTGFSNPGNIDNMQGSQSSAWAGNAGISMEDSLNLKPMQMGERVYIPGLGRFTSVDPVEGGTLNNYVYALDPINQDDYSGRFAFIPLLIAIVRVVITVVPIIIKAAPAVIKAVGSAVASVAAKAGPVVSKVAGAVRNVFSSAAPKASTVSNGVSKSTGAVKNTAPVLKGYQSPTVGLNTRTAASAEDYAGLRAQLFQKQVQSYGSELKGSTQVPLKLGDPRYQGGDWSKYQYIQKMGDGTKLNGHWMENKVTGAIEQFKFK